MTKPKSARTVSDSALRVLDIETIKVGHRYQRQVSESAIEKIMKGYDPKALGIPVIGERDDGTLWVVDGQQRIAALKRMKDRDRRWVRCEVFASNGPEHEALIFKLINANRTKLTAEQLFHAALVSGDEQCHKLKRIMDEYGMQVMRGRPQTQMTPDAARDAKRVRTINFLLRVLGRSEQAHNGEPAVRFILNVLSRVWPDDAIKQRSEIVEGLFSFWTNNNGLVDLDRLLPRLASTTPTKLVYSATLGVGSRGQNVADVLQRVYRKKVARPAAPPSPE
jgi:hypothetical protein